MGGLRQDPAIERWATMRETTVQHFRVTPKTLRQLVIFGVVVPVVMYEAAVREFNVQAERRGVPQRKYPSLFN